jgi:hypothetical protein
MTLGKWSYYFIAKLGLFSFDLMGFHALENLFFAAFILLPVVSRTWRRVKHTFSVVFAATLLYYDSWLPPLDRLFSQASLVSEMSGAYLLELLARFISIPVLGLLSLVWIACWFVSRRLRTGVLVLAGMMILAGVQGSIFSNINQLVVPSDRLAVGSGTTTRELDEALEAFFVKEMPKSVVFAVPAVNEVPFDVVFIFHHKVKTTGFSCDNALSERRRAWTIGTEAIRLFKLNITLCG